MPSQILSVKAKNDLPQIKFTKDYKPELEKVLAQMKNEFAGLKAGAA